MMTSRSIPTGGRRRQLIALLGTTALLVGACGSGSATPATTAAPPTQAATAQAATAAASTPVASDAGYTGPPATITYSIWGDATEIKAQQAVVDAFHASNPNITVNVTVSEWDTYWDKLNTSIAGGNAPDVFAMDGPLFPDYQSRDALLDLKPFIDRDGYDLTQLADLAVKDFTTAGGQFGLPRDLNVIALYYNKKMFDEAGIPYPDDSWDWAKLVEVGKQLTKDKDGDGRPDQWGIYTETSDMENYWSSLVWQNGGDIISADHKTNLIGSDQAVGGLQFLQDLIYKDKIMAVPTADAGDGFDAGLAAMEANGSWLVATHLDSKVDFGIAPLPKGSAGQATSINPTGAVIYKNTKTADASWQFVKYLTSPAAQTKLMELKSSLPANKAVLEGPFSTSFDGAKVLADAIAYAHLKPSFAGYDEWNTTLQTKLDDDLYNANNGTAREVVDAVLPALDKKLAGK